MGDQTTTTDAEIHEDGRLTLPVPARRALDVEGKSAILSLEVSVKRVLDDE